MFPIAARGSKERGIAGLSRKSWTFGVTAYGGSQTVAVCMNMAFSGVNTPWDDCADLGASSDGLNPAARHLHLFAGIRPAAAQTWKLGLPRISDLKVGDNG